MKYIVSSLIFFIFLIVPLHAIVAQDTIHVETGWNMIGDISKWDITQIISAPPGIISSSYFGYSSLGYTAVDSFQNGNGYWVKANHEGMLIGGTSTPRTVECGEAVPYGERVYNTVRIGNQCWFMQNLEIGTMVAGSTSQTNNSTIEKYCNDNNPANCTTYGGLYQWNEAMQYSTASGARGICPKGWHIPTLAQQQTLATAVINNGNSLKAVGQGTEGGSGTNTRGFSALLSGSRSIDGYFYDLAYYTYFWSSTEYYDTNAHYLYLYYNGSYIYFNNNYKGYGFSVRCLKD